MRSHTRRTAPARQALLVLLSATAAFTPACGPLPPEDLPTSAGDETSHESTETVDVGSSALTRDRKGRLFESKFERLTHILLKKRAEDQAGFERILASSFGDHYDWSAGESLRQKILASDFSWAPTVELVSSQTLGGQKGAYANATQVIYLDEGVPSQFSRAFIFIEELGHHLDTLLNVNDTPGDEGALFRVHLVGEKLFPEQWQAIQTNDHVGTIVVGGETVEVEFLFGIPNPLPKLKNAVTRLGSYAAGKFKTAGSFLKAQLGNAFAVSSAVGTWIVTVAADRADKFVQNLRNGSLFWSVYEGLQTQVHVVLNVAHGLKEGFAEGANVMSRAVSMIKDGDIEAGVGMLFGGLATIAASVAVDALTEEVLGALGAIQTLAGLEPVGRFLTTHEKQVLGTVFGYSKYGGTRAWINLIRLKEGHAGILSLVSKRAFTNGTTIYFKEKPYSEQLLVHETTHVWQFVNGGGDYRRTSLVAQAHKGNPEAYEWAPDVDLGFSWGSLNPEQQANFVDTAFDRGCFGRLATPCMIETLDRTDFFRRVREHIITGAGSE